MLLFFNNREKNSNLDNNLSSIITPIAVHKSGRTYGKNIADYYMNFKVIYNL